ncbi:MAG: molybdopterin molybdotransferase MoeA [Bacteroidota bacterium]|nr:molybdopterin molybdotransferase MoeA [Bacteroidota bacterium]
MITVEEAKSILIENSFKLNKTRNKKIKDSLNYFLAEDIFSPLDLPPFNQSNVDGYAVNFSGAFNWKVIDEIKAGDKAKLKLKESQAARVFTGAVVPEGADCVIMQERIEVDRNNISTNNFEFSQGEFIRLKGSQIKKRELAILKNILITPAVIGFLSTLGIEKITVYKKPVINLIITGNELQTPGKKLKSGKIYDSNSFILNSALMQMNLKPNKFFFLKDNKNKLKKTVSECFDDSDVILISGGVSVGKYDFVNEVLEELNAEKLFYKVSQRPGKPLYFGKKHGTYIFGLPGNPASVLTCFYEYVYPLLRKLQGYENYFLNQINLPLLKDLSKHFKLSNFLKAKIKANGVESLDGQPSYIIKSFAEADCFIYLPLETEFVKEGETVEVHLFP